MSWVNDTTKNKTKTKPHNRYRNDCIEIELEPPTLQTLAMQRLLHRGKALLEEIPSLPKKVAVEVARALREFPSQCE